MTGMNISGDFSESPPVRMTEPPGRLGIGRLAAVYIGTFAQAQPVRSITHRIMFDAVRGPHLVRSGEAANDDGATLGIAYLDPRRFDLCDVEMLLHKWQSLRNVENRLDDLLEDIDAVRGRRLNARVTEALSLLRESRSPEAIAPMVGLSETKLTRLFNVELGAPPKRWEIWMRLRRGMDLLFLGNSVTAASQETGFADSSHFSRACRAAFGLPPAILAKFEVRSSVPPNACGA